MDITEIVDKIINQCIQDNHLFSKIQEIRFKHGKKPTTWKPFSKRSIKKDYAFHSGGRDEFQFNVGVDSINGNDVFRYGLAFSLKSSLSLTDPKIVFKDTIKRFNSFFKTNQSFFDGFSFWYGKSPKFYKYSDSVQHIDDSLVENGNFIFIGKYFNKSFSEIKETDIDVIINTFDYLITAYEQIQFGQITIERRCARIVYNENGWIMPSGPYGKSKNSNSHEGKYGYGHEEWLLDTGKLIDGYHYGFLEPIRKKQDFYKGKAYNICLYTIDCSSKRRYWIGEIGKVEVISKDEANATFMIYKNNNWLNGMEKQIAESGASNSGFSHWQDIDLFNIRYKPENLNYYDQFIEIPESHPISKKNRYTFNKCTNCLKTVDNAFTFPETNESSTNSEENDIQTGSYTREPKTVEIVYLHKKMSKEITNILRSNPSNIAVRELSSGVGNNIIDIAVKDKNGELVFYEIKTYNSARLSIREAIGQLLEYSMWPDKIKANRLIIITPKPFDLNNVSIYLNHLRNTFKIPIFYQWFDVETNYLSQEY